MMAHSVRGRNMQLILRNFPKHSSVTTAIYTHIFYQLTLPSEQTLQTFKLSRSTLRYYVNTAGKTTVTLYLRLHQTSHYGYCNLDKTYKMDHSSL
jgi:hypothetical protein